MSSTKILWMFWLDNADKDVAKDIPCKVLITNTIMKTLDDKIRLAKNIIEFCGE